MRPLSLSLAATCLLATLASAQTKVLFTSATLNRQADKDILAYLEGRYGKANVTWIDTEPAGNLKESDVLAFDVAVLSSSPSSGRYRNIRLSLSAIPFVNMEEAVADNQANEFSMTTDRPKEREQGHTINIAVAHPITAGFTVNQKVQITDGRVAAPGEEVWWSSGAQAPGVVNLAHDDDTATNLFLTIVDQGGTLLNATQAPCRRVMFGMTDNTFVNFTADGKKLFGQAVDWAAAACCAQTSSYGQGLAGTNGIPTLTTSAAPIFKSSVNVLITNSSGAATSALLLVGSQQIDVPFLGGSLLVSPLLQALVPLPATGLTLPVQIPDLSALCGTAPQGLKFQAQVLQLDSGAAQGVSMSAGTQIKTGN